MSILRASSMSRDAQPIAMPLHMPMTCRGGMRRELRTFEQGGRKVGWLGGGLVEVGRVAWLCWWWGGWWWRWDCWGGGVAGRQTVMSARAPKKTAARSSEEEKPTSR